MNTEIKKHNTPLDELFFRSSSLGNIISGVISQQITEKQIQRLNELIELKDKPIGLTDKQKEELEKMDQIIKEHQDSVKACETALNEEEKEDFDCLTALKEQGAKLSKDEKVRLKDFTDSTTPVKGLTAKQAEKRDDYKKRLITPKGLTETQNKELLALIERRDAKPKLSEGGKSEVKKLWRQNEKGFKEEINTPKVNKGKDSEEVAINLVSDIDGITYYKNKERVTKGNITGECDIIKTHRKFMLNDESFENIKIVDDIKNSWNTRTFMDAKLSSLYEWQGRGYMYLYDADLFRLRYCLVDCPDHILHGEYNKWKWNNNIIDDSLPEYKDTIDQFYKNYKYADLRDEKGNLVYSKEEREKRFHVVRDFNLEAVMLQAVELAVEYYQTITLNMID